MKDFERRAYSISEIRLIPKDESHKMPLISGHAAVFNKLSEDLGWFRERVKRGAFKKTISEADIRALFNHNENYVLGRNKANTLRLWEDDKGLWSEIDPPDTQWARDLIVSVQRGDITQMSFGFRTINDSWATENGRNIRTLLEVALFDISLATFPAYPDTSIQARSFKKLGFSPDELNGVFIKLEHDLPLSKEDRLLIDRLTFAFDETRGVVTYQDLPLADRDRSWDASAAVQRVRKWAEKADGEMDWAKYSKAFLWFDSENPEIFGAYKLPIADIINDRLTAIPRAILAAGGVMMGARGGVDIPEADKAKVKSHLAKYYRKMDMTPPWEAEKDNTDIKSHESGSSRGSLSDSPTDNMKLNALHKKLNLLL